MVGKNWLALNRQIVLFRRFKWVHGKSDLKESKLLNASFNRCFFTLLKTFVWISKFILQSSHSLNNKLEFLFDVKSTCTFFGHRTYSDGYKQVVKTEYIYNNIFFSHNCKETNRNSCKSASFNLKFSFSFIPFKWKLSAQTLLLIKNNFFSTSSILKTTSADHSDRNSEVRWWWVVIYCWLWQKKLANFWNRIWKTRVN